MAKTQEVKGKKTLDPGVQKQETVNLDGLVLNIDEDVRNLHDGLGIKHERIIELGSTMVEILRRRGGNEAYNLKQLLAPCKTLNEKFYMTWMFAFNKGRESILKSLPKEVAAMLDKHTSHVGECMPHGDN